MKLWMGTVLAVLLAAGAANVQAPAAEQKPTRPEWIRKPSADEIVQTLKRVIRNGEPVGWALMKCHVTAKGILDPCRVIIENPDPGEIGKVALKLAPIFRLKPAVKDGQPVDGGDILVPIVIGSPEGTPRTSYAPGRPAYVLSPASSKKAGVMQMPCPLGVNAGGLCEAREIYWTDAPALEDTAPLILEAQQETGFSTVFCELTATGRFEKCQMDGENSPSAVKAMSRTLPKLKAPVFMSGEPVATPAIVALVYDWTILTKAARAILAYEKTAP